MLSLNGALSTAFHLPIHLASKILSCRRHRKTSESSTRAEIAAKISSLVKKLESEMLLYSAAARTFREHPKAFSDTAKALNAKEGEIETAIEDLGSLAQRVGKRAINFLSKEQVESFLEYVEHPFYYTAILGFAGEEESRLPNILALRRRVKLNQACEEAFKLQF